MKNGTRLYINILNQCNVNCPFCCMYSGTNKNRKMFFEQFRNIIDNTEGDFELQLEGGEPLLHHSLFLFMEYAVSTDRCKKILILTNGFLLENLLSSFLDFKKRHNIPIEFKVSINYYLINEYEKTHNKNFLSYLRNLAFSVEYIPDFNIMFNVRKRKDVDEWIDKELETYNLAKQSNVFYLQSYGKLTNSEYEKPIIVQNIEKWILYASDGTCFGQDLIARSEYEK